MACVMLLVLLSTLIGLSTSTDWIFGYGSLINKQSRDSTINTTSWHPVRIQGIRRGWFAPGTVADGWGSIISQRQQISTTFLGAYLMEGFTCNGVIFTVDPFQLAAFDKRELQGAGYTRETLNTSQVILLDHHENPISPNDRIFFYNVEPSLLVTPTFETPIVTSYVDVVLGGCVQIDKQFNNGILDFSKEFVRTTDSWSGYWVNDRLLPRRPWVYQPLSRSIDIVLAELLGEDLLRNITLDDPSDNDNHHGERIQFLENKIQELEKNLTLGIQIFLGICLFFVICMIFMFVVIFRSYSRREYL